MKTSVTLPGDKPAEKTEEKKGKSIHLDFSKKAAGKNGSPFKKAASQTKRLKLFLWGDYGVGKTPLALQFPKPAIIDLEGGADHYGDDYEFDILRAGTPDEVMEAVDWLLANTHAYRTLIIDPITIYWDSLQKKWSDIFLKRNKGSKGYKHEFYDLQVKDWLTIKGEFKELVRKLIALDMNVIVTARAKTKYKEGSFMVAVGETFDGEKSLPFMFDTIVHMSLDDKGRTLGFCVRDRCHKLPKGEFECSYSSFENLFGKQTLSRKAKPCKQATQQQKEKIKGYIEQFKLNTEQVAKRLAAYEADGVDDLTLENAEIIISKFEAAIAGAAKGGEKKEGETGEKEEAKTEEKTEGKIEGKKEGQKEEKTEGKTKGKKRGKEASNA